MNINNELAKLEEEHPELVALKSVMDLTDEENEEAASSRGFWVNFGQNLFFLVLGFVMSYSLAKLGWLH